MGKYKDFDDDMSFDDKPDTEYDDTVFEDEESDEEYARRRMEARRAMATRSTVRKRKKKSNKRWVVYLVIALELILIVGLSLVWYIVKKIDNVKEAPIKEQEIVTNPDIKQNTVEVLTGYTNILLLGTDAREAIDGSQIQDKDGINHTDAMLVASINNDTKEVRIISVYRDCLMEMGEYDETTGKVKDPVIDKATEAAFKYDITSAVSMINRNLDLDIKDVVMVNWSALIDMVDAVGGVDIPINLMEQRWLNRYLVDTSENTGRQYTEITTFNDVGIEKLPDQQLSQNKEMMSNKIMTHMTGIQATAFARIRFGDGKADYGRTERQRAVISQIVAKAKNMSNIKATAEALLENVYVTSYIKQYALKNLTSILNYRLTMIDGGFPFKRNDQLHEIDGFETKDPVIPVTLESNAKEFHRVLFDDDNYEPSDTIKNISEKIIRITGVKN